MQMRGILHSEGSNAKDLGRNAKDLALKVVECTKFWTYGRQIDAEDLGFEAV